YFDSSLHRSRTHPHLHSFPTRRSSDLSLGRGGPRAVGVRIVGLPADVVHVELVEQLHPDPIFDEAAQDALAEQFARPEALRLVRSEEHTSELQSRSDLVCRLLLEKKKT